MDTWVRFWRYDSLWGSFNRPTWHMPNVAFSVPSLVSIISRCSINSEPCACSRWKCLLVPTWCMHRSLQSFKRHRSPSRSLETRSNKVWPLPLYRENLPQSRHSGATHMWFGSYIMTHVHNFWTPSFVDKSPSNRVNWMAWPPLAFTCWTNWELGSQYTSRRSTLRPTAPGWPLIWGWMILQALSPV